MLIEAARRFEAAAKEMLSAMNGSSVSCDEARQVLAACKSAAAALTATQTSAAAVVAGVERHGDGGAQVLADAAGLSRRDAVGRVRTAQAVGAAPAVRDAVETGRVSQANAKRLAEAIEKTSAEAVESDTELLSKAASMRPEQFTRETRKWAADRQGDGGEGDYRRLRARRRVRVWDSDDDGMVHIHGEFDPVAGHRIGNRLRAVAGRLHGLDKAQASDKSERRSFDQCMADALDSLTAGNLARPPRLQLQRRRGQRLTQPFECPIRPRLRRPVNSRVRPRLRRPVNSRVRPRLRRPAERRLRPRLRRPAERRLRPRLRRPAERRLRPRCGQPFRRRHWQQ